MDDESISASKVISAKAEAIFAVLVDPASHAAIDGTGWVCEALDVQLLTNSGQIFRMAMYHPNHPNGAYEMANRIEVFAPPNAIAWKPGYDPGDGVLQFGGWIWRYDLIGCGPSNTEVLLSYDWSEVSQVVRQTGPAFPPFPPEHLHNSLSHLAMLVSGEG
jgi:hypothetical protein